MANLLAVAGSKIFIGTRVASKGEVTLSDFVPQESLWKEIGGWTSAGALGDTVELITQNVINEGRARQAKGTKAGGTMENTFIPLPNDPGHLEFREAIDSCDPYAFKIEWGAGCTNTGVVGISVGASAVVTWIGHALEAGSPVSFTSTGTLPTGMTAGTVYYVSATGLTATAFSVSATPGGAPIATTVAGTGVHTATGQPAGQTNLFYGLAMPGEISGGDANTPQLRTWSIAVDSNIVEV